jgi:glyoxylase-like metal-dependent hydrolase (beta-lactamase superfamily II)
MVSLSSFHGRVPMRQHRRALLGIIAGPLAGLGCAVAQPRPNPVPTRAANAAPVGSYSAPRLSDVRRAALLIPGDAPSAIHVVPLNPFRIPLAAMVEGGSAEQADASNPVFQVRFPRGWIAVDAGVDRALVPDSKTFSDEQYASIQSMLRDARLIVVTHEHEDHVAGVIRSPYLAAVQEHTLLTRAQLRSLMTAPNDPRIKLDSAAASRYFVLDYDPLLPIAPGVVLIKAPGHTPGSQMVYVRLASGSELVLAGDVAWHSSGIATQRQKPDSSTRDFGGEDRAAIATELRWLKDAMASGVTVIVAHDQANIASLVARGALKQGFDVERR